jgi:hypothetical protein
MQPVKNHFIIKEKAVRKAMLSAPPHLKGGEHWWQPKR